MIIYGVALLSICYLVGNFAGELLGCLLHEDKNVGGVGFSMLLLMFLTERMRKLGHFNSVSAGGVQFWAAMYIPIVVAMAAQQNVMGAIKGGWVAFFAGLLAFIASFMAVPVINRIGLKKHLETSTWNPVPEEDRQ
jgi:malonate transporter MadL subunit